MKNSNARRGWRGLAAGMGVAVVATAGLGCSSDAFFRPVKDTTPSVSAKVVKTDGACLGLGELKQSGSSAEQLVTRVAELTATQRSECARRLIRRHPDAAQDALLGADRFQGREDALLVIADAHGRQCAGPAGAEAWPSMIRDRLAQPNRFEAFDAARAQAVEANRVGRGRDALKLGLVEAAPCPLLRCEALRLTAEALTLDDKRTDAVAAYEAALETIKADQPYLAAQFLLALGEAQRRAERIDAGVATWRNAVAAGADLLSRNPAIRDPGFWERAAALRPVSAAWPDGFGSRLAQLAGVRAQVSGSDEAWLWANIGHWRLDRNEANSSLAAFKRAETLMTEPTARELMAVGEAHALARMGQEGSAAGVLMPIAAKSGSAAAAPALALLGALKLREGNAAQGTDFLDAALRQSWPQPWRGHAEAEADLALALLAKGDETRGMVRLHSAENAAADDAEFLALCLANEARYLEHRGRPGEAAALQDRIRKLEQGSP